MVERLAVEIIAGVVVKHGSDVEMRAVEAVDGSWGVTYDAKDVKVRNILDAMPTENGVVER